MTFDSGSSFDLYQRPILVQACAAYGWRAEREPGRVPVRMACSSRLDPIFAATTLLNAEIRDTREGQVFPHHVFSVHQLGRFGGLSLVPLSDNDEMVGLTRAYEFRAEFLSSPNQGTWSLCGTRGSCLLDVLKRHARRVGIVVPHMFCLDLLSVVRDVVDETDSIPPWCFAHLAGTCYFDHTTASQAPSRTKRSLEKFKQMLRPAASSHPEALISNQSDEPGATAECPECKGAGQVEVWYKPGRPIEPCRTCGRGERAT